MHKKAFVVIDIQNDITKHYRDIISKLNAAIDWAADQRMDVVYIKHNNLSPGTRTFKPDTNGAEFVPELKIVSDNVFIKTMANALTCEGFSDYIRVNGIDEFYITGADATACVKSTCFNMTKAGYTVHVISDCVTSYDLKKLPEMLTYYADKGCEVRTLVEYGVLEEYQGQGYATEAVRAAVDLALQQPGVTLVEAETEPDNRASPRVLEKCGFLPSGTVGKEGPRYFKTACEHKSMRK